MIQPISFYLLHASHLAFRYASFDDALSFQCGLISFNLVLHTFDRREVFNGFHVELCSLG